MAVVRARSCTGVEFTCGGGGSGDVCGGGVRRRREGGDHLSIFLNFSPLCVTSPTTHAGEVGGGALLAAC